ncbi:hypothetical protein F5882DRAFT_416038 [Hyaloscypha sp. PMI_1271]|nr:hypothetical protein F5882DRAFT_416038 [Hyaloscypha sp. PMI_1271]
MRWGTARGSILSFPVMQVGGLRALAFCCGSVTRAHFWLPQLRPDLAPRSLRISSCFLFVGPKLLLWDRRLHSQIPCIGALGKPANHLLFSH